MQRNQDVTSATTSVPPVPPVPVAVLDEFRRGRVCGMISLGTTRREAARAVGCHAATISRTAQRDAEFARQLADAETLAQVRPLKAMYEATTRSWRAAAWLLERTQPEQFARRPVGSYTRRDVREVVDRLLEFTLPHVADSMQTAVCDLADDLVQQVGETEAVEPSNPLVEMEKMIEGLDDYRQARADAANAADVDAANETTQTE